MSKIVLEDETLRDGLQVEQKIFSTEEKCELFDLLLTAGVRRVQAGSFVHPKYVPQMADTDQLIPRLRERAGDAAEGLLLSGLVLNAKGLERALACGLTHLSMSVSVSEEHSKRNVKRSVDEALSSMTELIGQAKEAGVIVRAGAQCAFGCVYEGAIPKERVLKAFECMVAAGADEINLADTTGMGNPVLVRDLVADVRTRWPHIVISLHMHDTRGLGLANMVAGYEAGATVFDTATGGLGGCPFVRGAAGNVPTEDAANMFHAMGVDTGIDVDALCAAVGWLESRLERSLPGRMSRVIAAEAARTAQE